MRDPRIKLMIDKLYDQLQRDCLPAGFVEDFVLSVRNQFIASGSLSAKQIKVLEDLFERY